MTNNNSGQPKINIENVMIKNATLNASTRPLKYQHWRVDLIGRPATLIVDGREIKVDYIEMCAYVRYHDMGEDTLRTMFPDAFDASHIKVKSTVNTGSAEDE